MSPEQAKAQIFMTALHAMPRREQDSFFMALLTDKEFREDITDLVTAFSRDREPTKPFRKFLQDLRK